MKLRRHSKKYKANSSTSIPMRIFHFQGVLKVPLRKKTCPTALEKNYKTTSDKPHRNQPINSTSGFTIIVRCLSTRPPSQTTKINEPKKVPGSRNTKKKILQGTQGAGNTAVAIKKKNDTRQTWCKQNNREQKNKNVYVPRTYKKQQNVRGTTVNRTYGAAKNLHRTTYLDHNP